MRYFDKMGKEDLALFNNLIKNELKKLRNEANANVLTEKEPPDDILLKIYQLMTIHDMFNILYETNKAKKAVAKCTKQKEIDDILKER